MMQGDITSEDTIHEVLSHFKPGEKADLVISDGAPDVTGQHDVDQYVQAQLIIAALTLVARVLKEGGTFVVRFARMTGSKRAHTEANVRYADVIVCRRKFSVARTFHCCTHN
jgi:tRNA (cytidine32/guanosine34-2'-O)-methyltransferase